MRASFPKAENYLKNLDWEGADELDVVTWELLSDKQKFQMIDDVLGRRFRHGRGLVPGVDRGGRTARVKREQIAGRWFKYLVEGADGLWREPEERVWVLAMVELARRKKRAT